MIRLIHIAFLVYAIGMAVYVGTHVAASIHSTFSAVNQQIEAATANVGPSHE